MKNLICSLAALLALPFAAFSQTTTVSGKVNSASGEPLPYALVQLEGTYNSTLTKPDGSFSFQLSGNSYCLAVRLLGYENFRHCYALPGDENITIVMLPAAYMKEELIVSGTRADENSAMSYSTVTKEEIKKQNYGQDLPMLLNMQTSVVTTSDAGTGFGYTGIRIRGSDATRVNVSINGIPVNDAESQGMYWVDMPDLASSTDNIQIQRGVGTSANGAGSFGGSVNLQTGTERNDAYGELLLSGGSFNSWRVTAKAGTGLLKEHWMFETRLSRLQSDGYIDRGSSDLKSWYMSGAYYGKKLTVKAISFSGDEKTYQCWYGVPQDLLKTNRTFNPAGIHTLPNGTIAYYDNETDNYRQDYYQLHFILRTNENWKINWAFHATKGKGYYEQYREGENLSAYGLDTANTYSDLVRRKWLDNWFYGITWNANYNSEKKLSFAVGGAVNNYEGAHYSEIIWGTSLPYGTPPVYRYEDNFASKSDANIYSRLNYAATDAINLFADLQYRNVQYHFSGPDTNGVFLPQKVNLNFFNPKAGITLRVSGQSYVYASIAVGNKEPNRDDFVNSTSESRPQKESLYDGELGWKFRSKNLIAEANLYYMHYTDQLVLTGKINDVGAYTRENVPISFRRGIELAAAYKISKQFSLAANTTLSQNQIKNFHEFIDDYDNGVQIDSLHASPDIAFSPAAIAALQLNWEYKRFRSSLQGKYVSKQYLDNTSNESRMIDSYFTGNLLLSWTAIKKQEGENIRTKSYLMDELSFGLQINNLFNTLYSSNGYTYGYIYGGSYSLNNYYFPQAGINAMGMVTMRF